MCLDLQKAYFVHQVYITDYNVLIEKEIQVIMP